MLGYSVANGLVVGPDGSADLDGKALKAAVSPFLCLRGMCSLVDDTVTNRQPCDVAEIPEGGTETTISAGVLGSNMSRLAGARVEWPLSVQVRSTVGWNRREHPIQIVPNGIP
jgi:hypothetical protein